MTILTAFETIGIAMLVFPRSTESITEKRELKKFPELSAESWFSGEFTEGISEWFSDTVPARDEVTNLSTQLRELRGFRQDGIRLHNVGTVQSEISKPSTTVPEQPSAPGRNQPASGSIIGGEQRSAGYGDLKAADCFPG